MAKPRPAVGLCVFVTLVSALAWRCGSSVTTLKPTPTKCPTTLSSSIEAIAADGGAGSVSVSTQPECEWTAQADASWISDLSPVSGQGSGVIRFTAAKNAGATGREGAIVVNDQRLAIRQDASCPVTVTPASITFAAGGGSVEVQVSAADGCKWSIHDELPWISVNQASHAGPATITIVAATNNGGSRAGSVTIGGQTISAAQKGAGSSDPPPPQGPLPPPDPNPSPAPPPGQLPGCTFALSSTSLNAGSAAGTTSVSVTTGASCPWSIASGAGWISASGSTNRTGPGTVSISYAANPGTGRSGSVTIAGLAFTISQAGACAVSLTPMSQTVGAGAGAGTAIAVSTGAGCGWNATAGAAWISIAAPAAGSGAGQIAFTVAANNGPQRQSTITVGTQSATVTQQSGCTYSVNPASMNVNKGGEKNLKIDVTTAAGCTWSAATPDDWITITSGASGSGSGSVVFDVAKQNGPSRTGTIVVAGLTVTIKQ